MNDILSIIEELAENGSSLKKIEILKSHKNNELLKRVLVATMDPYINYWIRKIPKYNARSALGWESLDWAINSLKGLSNRTYTGHTGVAFLKMILEEINGRDALVIEKIIDGDLRCGVSIGTVKKVWPYLVPEFNVMLATGATDKIMESLQYPQMVQDKEDGMRCIVLVKDGEVEFRSRNGKLIDLHGNMVASFNLLAAGRDIVFDGEMLIRRNGMILNRQTGNGILNKAVKGTISEAEAAEVIIRLWDEIDYIDFFAGECKTTEINRYNSLRLSHANYMARRTDDGKIQLLDTVFVDNEDELNELFQNAMDLKKEGLIAKNPNGTWKNKRSKDWIKIKSGFYKGDIIEMDLKVVGWNEGTGKNKGRLGALTVENLDGTIRTNVGTGFSDAQREEITEESYLGKIVTIQSTGVIKAKNAEVSKLFLPVFVHERPDKHEPDL